MEGQPLLDLRDQAPFRAVVILEAPCSREWQERASAWLIDQGCRYMMAWGLDCSSWNDSVDLALIGTGDEEISDQRMVMTTWHDAETLESVMWFAQSCACFSTDDKPLDDAVLIHVSGTDREAAFRHLWDRAAGLPERVSG